MKSRSIQTIYNDQIVSRIFELVSAKMVPNEFSITEEQAQKLKASLVRSISILPQDSESLFSFLEKRLPRMVAEELSISPDRITDVNTAVSEAIVNFKSDLNGLLDLQASRASILHDVQESFSSSYLSENQSAIDSIFEGVLRARVIEMRSEQQRLVEAMHQKIVEIDTLKAEINFLATGQGPRSGSVERRNKTIAEKVAMLDKVTSELNLLKINSDNIMQAISHYEFFIENGSEKLFKSTSNIREVLSFVQYDAYKQSKIDLIKSKSEEIKQSILDKLDPRVRDAIGIAAKIDDHFNSMVEALQKGDGLGLDEVYGIPLEGICNIFQLSIASNIASFLDEMARSGAINLGSIRALTRGAGSASVVSKSLFTMIEQLREWAIANGVESIVKSFSLAGTISGLGLTAATLSAIHGGIDFTQDITAYRSALHKQDIPKMVLQSQNFKNFVQAVIVFLGEQYPENTREQQRIYQQIFGAYSISQGKKQLDEEINFITEGWNSSNPQEKNGVIYRIASGHYSLIDLYLLRGAISQVQNPGLSDLLQSSIMEKEQQIRLELQAGQENETGNSLMLILQSYGAIFSSISQLEDAKSKISQEMLKDIARISFAVGAMGISAVGIAGTAGAALPFLAGTLLASRLALVNELKRNGQDVLAAKLIEELNIKDLQPLLAQIPLNRDRDGFVQVLDADGSRVVSHNMTLAQEISDLMDVKIQALEQEDATPEIQRNIAILSVLKQDAKLIVLLADTDNPKNLSRKLKESLLDGVPHSSGRLRSLFSDYSKSTSDLIRKTVDEIAAVVSQPHAPIVDATSKPTA